MDNSNSGKFGSGLLFGIVIGAIAGLLLAPQTGEETRKKVQNTIEDLQEQLNRLVERVKKETNSIIEKGKNYIDDKNDQKSVMDEESSKKDIF
jgi:gas vesicle protein